MKLTDIQQELRRLFDEQDSAVGAVVVWHDPDGPSPNPSTHSTCPVSR